MEKQKLRDPERVKEFITETTETIIKAELDTYMETKISDFEPRIYMFTPYSVGIATVSFPDNVPPLTVYTKAISEFKSREKDSLSEIAREIYDANGGKAPLTALVSFIPTKAVRIHKSDVEFLDEPIREAIKNNTLTPELMEEFNGGKYKDKITITLMIQLDTFFKNEIRIYEVIPHNDEVLDMKYIHTADIRNKPAGTGAMNILYKLIEVE